MLQRKRWIAIFMLVAVLTLTMSSLVSAAGSTGVTTGQTSSINSNNTEDTYGNPVDTSQTNNTSTSQSGSSSPSTYSSSYPLLNNPQTQGYYAANKPGYGEQFIAGILVSFVKWLMGMFNLSDPVLLVFNQNPNNSTGFLASGLGSLATGDYVLGIFPTPYFNAVTVLYSAFKSMIGLPLVIMLLIMAISHMLNSGTVQGRGKIKDHMQAFVVAIATVRFGVYIWTAIVQLNNFFVKLIWAYMLKEGVKPAFFMDMIWGPGQQGFNQATQMGSIGMAILLIMAALMVATLNYQYTMRMITLGLLIAIFPLAATLSIFPNFRHSLPMWFKEYVANVILQLAHALALGAFFLTLVMPGSMAPGVAFWLMLTYFAGLPTISALIRELLGLQGGGNRVMSGLGAMTGIASMMAMSRMFMRRSGSKDTFSGGEAGNGMMENPMSGASAVSSGSGSRLTGAISQSGKIVQGAFNTAGSILGSKPVQTAGKFALGATAAMAGGVLTGAMTGNASSGAMLGVGAASVAGRKNGLLAGMVGSAGDSAKEITQTLTTGGSIKDVGQNLMAGSMQKGGALASAGWGLQSAVNKVASITGNGEPFAAPSYMKSHRTMLNNAHQGMQELRPQMEIAKAKYDFAKAHFGAGSSEAEPAKAQFESMKTKYGEHETSAVLAQTKMRSYSELKSYAAGRTSKGAGTSSYSTGRGRV